MGKLAKSALLWIACFVVFVGLLFVDHRIYQLVHDNYSYYTRPIPDHLKITTRVLRSMEDWGENVFIVCVAYAMWVLDRHRRSRVACIVVSAVLVSLAVEGTKRLVGRERPEVSKGQLVLHGPSAWSQGGDFQSFPSGHTASGASYSGSIAVAYPPLRPVCIALAVGCAANRIWKERHFASDCWVGGVFGYWFAFRLPRRRWMQRFLAWFDRRFSVPLLNSASTSEQVWPRSRCA